LQTYLNFQITSLKYDTNTESALNIEYKDALIIFRVSKQLFNQHLNSILSRGKGTFPLTSVSRPALGPTQPPVQWVPGVLYLGVKRSWGMTLTTHPHLVPSTSIGFLWDCFTLHVTRIAVLQNKKLSMGSLNLYDSTYSYYGHSLLQSADLTFNHW
jgi:hypothetical protein